jgi:ATPase subunit of ABC transporter with duplicated ATPase domains
MSVSTTPKTSYNHGNVILRFDKVSFAYGDQKPILDEASFVVREHAKLTLMGQNGAGKSTILHLISGALAPDDGAIHIEKGTTIAMAKQAVSASDRGKTVREFFEGAFNKKIYDIEPRIQKVLGIVHLTAPLDRKISTFSGGQQARLLLAYALIQAPDILLLDEPTNNLDHAGIEHLTKFLIEYPKTCIVISHDADFLNAFTHGVLYLDSFLKKVEQYVGNYKDVVAEISARIERERMKNVRLERDIANRKEQAGFFAQKGGHMRDVARKMREKIEELEQQVVDERREDRTIRPFQIKTQDFSEPVATITSVSVMSHAKPIVKKVNIVLKKGERLLIAGPNGIGKTTLLEHIASGGRGVALVPGLRLGYYRQDFSGLDPEITAYKALAEVMREGTDEELRSTAAHFLLGDDVLRTKVGALSEGQKGLLSFARLVLLRPGLLILDEPTNHINFRHIPVIAEALNKFEGAMILVSHAKEFVSKIKIDETLDLGKL